MDVLDMEEACQFLKLSKPMLYKHVRAGKIPAFKVGRIWRFHRNSLDEWVRGRVSEDTQARRKTRSR